MEDYKDFTYYQLKDECKKQGIPIKGKADELRAKLKGESQEEETVPLVSDTIPVIKEEAIAANPPEKKVIIPATPEELNRFLPDAKIIQPIDTSKYNAWLTDERLQKLHNRIAPIAASKGKFRFDIDHKGAAFQVEFSGKGPLLESTTLIDTDDQIVRRAEVYFKSRLVIGKNGQQSGI